MSRVDVLDLPKPKIGCLEIGMLREVLAGAAETKDAAVEDEGAIRRGQRPRRRLLDNYDRRPAPADSTNQGIDDIDHQGRESERRLVEQQQFGAAQQRASDHELLLFSAGQLTRKLVTTFAQDRECLEIAVDFSDYFRFNDLRS
jgi:hypothetical protein